jgi:hypothetical protein
MHGRCETPSVSGPSCCSNSFISSNSCNCVSGSQPGKPARKRASPCGKLTTSVDKYSGCVWFISRADCCSMLPGQLRPAQPIEQHHRAADARGSQLLQRLGGREVGFTLADPRQNFVVTRLCPHINQRQARIAQRLQIGHRFVAQISRQAIAGNAAHSGQVLSEWLAVPPADAGWTAPRRHRHPERPAAAGARTARHC